MAAADDGYAIYFTGDGLIIHYRVYYLSALDYGSHASVARISGRPHLRIDSAHKIIVFERAGDARAEGL
jgi:hypothetical protein